MRTRFLSFLALPLLVSCLAVQVLAEGSKTITLPTALTQIGARAFYGTDSVEAVIISDGVEVIGEEAFAGSSVTEITIPSSITQIGDRAFADCTRLSRVIYNGSASQWAAIDMGEDVMDADVEIVMTGIAIDAHVLCNSGSLALDPWGYDPSEVTLTIDYDGDWNKVTDVVWKAQPITLWYVEDSSGSTIVQRGADGLWYPGDGDTITSSIPFDLSKYLTDPDAPFTITETAAGEAVMTADTGRCDADLQANVDLYAVLTLDDGSMVVSDPVTIHLEQPYSDMRLNDGIDPVQLNVGQTKGLSFGGSGSNMAFNAVAYVWSEDTTIAQVNNDRIVKGISVGSTVIHYDWYYNDPDRNGTPSLSYTLNVDVVDPDGIGIATAIVPTSHVQLMIGDDERNNGLIGTLYSGNAPQQLMNVPVQTDLPSGVSRTYTVQDPTLLSVDSLGRMTALTDRPAQTTVTFEVTGGGDRDSVSMLVLLGQSRPTASTRPMDDQDLTLKDDIK